MTAPGVISSARRISTAVLSSPSTPAAHMFLIQAEKPRHLARASASTVYARGHAIHFANKRPGDFVPVSPLTGARRRLRKVGGCTVPPVLFARADEVIE
jgi:hypothetical protein